ncbi:glycosyltransferase family 9 protein [Pseudaeromonas sharmana]|uniref:Glycosyltransferase family 9 protein n=1 Tax=Pseudaeromonas sharmana TaxID=328412 RepID=A0ABV8CL66_9GAMM
MMKAISHALQHRRDLWRRQLGIWLFDQPVRASRGTPGRVVLVRWDAKFGDAIVSSWIFDALRQARPGIQVDVITTPAMAWLFRDHLGADHVYECPKRAGYRQLATLARDLGSIECLVHFSKQLKMKDLFFLSKVRTQHVAGLDDHLQAIDIKLGKRCQGMHFVDKFRQLAVALGVTACTTDYRVPCLPTHEQAVTAFWPTHRPVIAVNGYGSGKSRRLTRENLQRLIDLILTQIPEVDCCLLFAPDSRDEVLSLVADAHNSRLFCYPDSQHIADAIAQIRQAKALISVDTATVHIGVGLNKPVFGLYNPDTENLQDWGPRHAAAEVLISQATEPQDINTLPWDELAQRLPLWWQRTTGIDEKTA